MSTAVSCQEPSFVGGQRYDCPYSVPTSAESVDVSKETLVSFWTAGPLDNTVCLHEPSQQETVYNLGYETEPTWTDHLSPQLQRNKQLQDTLLQREEELARLQEENNKLKEFLNSSIVKCLEDKTKKLLSAQRGTGTRNRKRMLLEDGRFSRLNASHLLLGTHGKRTCRNLSLDFCSAEELAATPPMDSWILQTLGLKDKDTIDPSANYSSNITSSANYVFPYATGTGQHHTTTPHCLESSCTQQTLGGSTAHYPTPGTPRVRTEVAFSMSLEPWSSVRTHSFPQGQAFVCRDTCGGWNFSWVPKDAA
ncbi:hypothetical protein MATL_G00120310 [Megalops atlanticus]|uniref:Geminin coiled-coil domain containing n=1 Tax=Megalops atlanticus TaxID=7932 RepID=A0A9D3T5N7_MEGAT|nr:hypothetical protein MATL_G00120310 [Megalops atlanticus]